MRNVIRRFAFLGAVMGLGLAVGTQAADDKDKKDESKPVDDRTFVMKVSQGNLAEIGVGLLAQQQGMSPAAKQFGQRLVADHTKANEQLNALATTKNIPVARDMGREHRQVLDKLAALRGADFDRQFAKELVEDHQKDIALFEAKSKDAQDNDIKTFATQTLPTLKEHLRMAQSLAGQNRSGAEATGTGPDKTPVRPPDR